MTSAKCDYWASEYQQGPLVQHSGFNPLFVYLENTTPINIGNLPQLYTSFKK